MFYKIFLIFLFSVFQASVSTVLSIVIALPIVHFFYKFDFCGKKFFISICAMLCIMPTKVVALCISLFYGATGFTGIVLAHLMLNVPFAIFIINSACEKLDTTLLWLAADSGACAWRCYKDIIFPILRSTIISIAFLLFLLHFASFSIPLILGGQFYHSTPEIIMSNMYNQGNNFSMLIFWLVRLAVIVPLFFSHNRFSLHVVKSSSVPNTMPRLRYSILHHNFLWILYCFFAVILILGPFFALVCSAYDAKVFVFFKSIFSFVADPTLEVSVYRVIFNSVLLAIVSSIGAVFVGFLLGVIELNWKSKLGKFLISFISVLAFFIGTVGVGVIFALLSYGKFISSFLIGVLCHVFLNYAFSYRIIRAQIGLYHSDLHKSAQTLGATCKKAIWTVVVPFVSPSLFRAFCVSFGLSLTEVGAGTILHSKIGLTIPMAIRLYRKCGNQEAVIGMSLILFGLVLLVSFLFLYKD